MASLHSIFQNIADIISNNSDRDSLKLKIETHQLDWEKIVPVASSHLVIPLIYCKLKEKELLDLIPEDLKSYLEEITRQNRERNKAILKEVQEISTLLNEKKIDHVFLKGAAMLASGIYTNIGERMIGDIDILVHPEQLGIAQELLIRNEYQAIETTFGQKFNEHKHLARLIPITKLAAVEIHRKLLRKSVKHLLQPTKILDKKTQIKGISIPCYKDLLTHVILNFEVNDYGFYYNYLVLRNSYDALILMDKINAKDLNELASNKYVMSFFNKVSYYFKNKKLNQRRSFLIYRKKFFFLKQKSRFISNSSYGLLKITQFCSILIHRFYLFITNDEYRNDALKDRKRIIKLIKNNI